MAALSHAELVTWLRELTLFKSLGDAAVQQVAEQGRWRSFEKGKVIIQEGKTGNTMYVIREGEVSVRSRTRHAINNGSGKTDDEVGTSSLQVDVELATIPAGGYFGELALLSANNLRIADVVAVTDCRCLEIKRNTFYEIINPTVKLTETSQKRSYEKEKEVYQQWRARKLAEERKRNRQQSRGGSERNTTGQGSRYKGRNGKRSGSLAQRSSIGRHSLALDELFADADGNVKIKPKGKSAHKRASTLTGIPEAKPSAPSK